MAGERPTRVAPVAARRARPARPTGQRAVDAVLQRLDRPTTRRSPPTTPSSRKLGEHRPTAHGRAGRGRHRRSRSATSGSLHGHDVVDVQPDEQTCEDGDDRRPDQRLLARARASTPSARPGPARRRQPAHVEPRPPATDDRRRSRRRASTVPVGRGTETYCATPTRHRRPLGHGRRHVELTALGRPRPRRPSPAPGDQLARPPGRRAAAGHEPAVRRRRLTRCVVGVVQRLAGPRRWRRRCPRGACPTARHVDAGLDAEGVARRRAARRCPRRCRGPRAPPCRCRGRCGGRSGRRSRRRR